MNNSQVKAVRDIRKTFSISIVGLKYSLLPYFSQFSVQSNPSRLKNV